MAEPLRDRARRATGWRLRSNGDARPHYVVCGNDPLAYWVVRSLLATEPSAGRVRVTLVVPERRRSDGPDGRDLDDIQVIFADRLDEATFRRAGLAGAAGLALLHQDDVGNMHAALCAQEVEPRLRLVVRMFNTRLANGLREFFPDSAVLSDASIAAPAFVAAALGELAPTHFRHAGRTLYAARRTDVRHQDVLCGLAVTTDPELIRVLPADEPSADVVLAEATGQPAGTELAARRLARARRRREPVVVLLRALRSFATRKIGVAVLALLAVIAVLGWLNARAAGVNWSDALYLTLVTTLSGQDPDLNKPGAAQVMQVVLNLAGLALIPLITAAVVDGIVNARLALHTGRIQPDRTGHVVVVGLGNIGTRVMAQLNDFGVEVVAIDRNPEARGASLAHRLGVPLIVGDAGLEETLRAASVATCQALVVVSTDDGTNLRAALNARSLDPELRVVLRLFDGDFAERIQRAFGIGTSRSVSYLAAPAFAAALLDRAVIATIPVGRHALLVTEVPVMAGSPLDGRPLAAVARPGEVRLLAYTRSGQKTDWSADPRMVIQAGDRLTVVARRAGLSALLRETTPAPAEPAGTPGPRQSEE
ncbi:MULTISPECIES: TrkA family potassium uptake protein [Micromonospora]|uniref:TrkA family potassium uptake protein n=1 Tax=Micromonospora solifontis TaxID=2487138 RepID=A0ABX9WGJ8_9ACTN|nr:MULTISPECIES: NAD-binding protein [Micromonospora]NES16715.1 TrkA family potassium uptake protein [Micromonospora sp. PPF5-17B]NES37717.1 TrkA family potassium uptake protein [Micromonospora solifontis]NES58455.1 TrkA family potassium uptake protein [Micromonospora sp. PPF5-6]RNL98061.1 TrkA family potassium uptake protein [Micromonospora solifontis]